MIYWKINGKKTINFICNDNVAREYLWRYGMHLNNEGTRVFAGNLVDYLNDFILGKNIWLLNSETSLKPTGSLKQSSEDSQIQVPTNNCN